MVMADAGGADTPSPGLGDGPGEGASLPVTFADVAEAARSIAGAVPATPAVAAAAMSRLAGAEVVLKLENLQLAGSFKARGAFNKLASLSPEQRRQGVVPRRQAITPRVSPATLGRCRSRRPS